LLCEREEQYDQLINELRPAVERFETGHPGVRVNIEQIKALGRKHLVAFAGA
jgi:hypothetical protein